MKTLYAPMAVADLDRDILSRAVQFYDKLGELDQSIQEISSIIFECLVVVSQLALHGLNRGPR